MAHFLSILLVWGLGNFPNALAKDKCALYQAQIERAAALYRDTGSPQAMLLLAAKFRDLGVQNKEHANRLADKWTQVAEKLDAIQKRTDNYALFQKQMNEIAELEALDRANAEKFFQLSDKIHEILQKLEEKNSTLTQREAEIKKALAMVSEADETQKITKNQLSLMKTMGDALSVVLARLPATDPRRAQLQADINTDRKMERTLEERLGTMGEKKLAKLKTELDEIARIQNRANPSTPE